MSLLWNPFLHNTSSSSTANRLLSPEDSGVDPERRDKMFRCLCPGPFLWTRVAGVPVNRRRSLHDLGFRGRRVKGHEGLKRDASNKEGGTRTKVYFSTLDPTP